jgi:hypothetical protein
MCSVPGKAFPLPVFVEKDRDPPWPIVLRELRSL